MKRLKLFVFLILCGITAFPILAASDSNATILHKITDKDTNENPKNRPKAPARNGIVCTYSSGGIELVLPSDITMVSVVIWNENETAWTGIISHDEPYSPLPGLSGEYRIECVGDNGSTYSSILYF